MSINFNEAALILLVLKNKGNQCRPSRHSRKEVMTWAEIGAVPIPINFNPVEIGAVLATILKKKMKARTVLVNHLRNQVLDKDSARGSRVCASS